MEHLFTFGWQFLVIMLLVLGNGFFVASEFAMVKIRSSQLRPMLKKGDWRVPIALRVTDHLDAYLAATQLGITLTSIGLGAYGKPFVAHWVRDLLHFFGVTNEVAIDSLSFTLAFSFISFLHIVLGELAPKSLAIQKPKPVTLWISPVLLVFYYVFFPFIWLMNGAANLLLKSVGIAPAKEDHDFSFEELDVVLMHSTHVRPSDRLITKLMRTAMRLKETTAEQIMIPREQVVCLWKNKPLAENMAVAQKSGYSRFPLCGLSQDDVLGVVLTKELLWQHQALGDQTGIDTILHPVLSFTRQTTLPAMLELFRKSRNHLAVVLDQNEKMIGVVSFEDVLEELVGDIRDELDIEKGPFYQRSETSVVVDADVPMRDLEIEMGWTFESHGRQRETVEQWALRLWGGKPKVGEEMVQDGIRVRAMDTCATGLRRVKFTQEPPEELP
ncbi:MAG: hemolysin family protein [Bacteroidia bacterium]|nr:hemolysin family protein [Bacteroidia bacterium]